MYFCSALFHTALYSTVLCCAVVLFDSVLFCSLWFCASLASVDAVVTSFGRSSVDKFNNILK
jgi:hypothetical protein